MEYDYMEFIRYASPMILAVGVAWGSVKVGMNGQKEKLKEVDKELNEHKEAYYKDSRQIVKTLASLETKVDLLIDHKIKE